MKAGQRKNRDSGAEKKKFLVTEKGKVLVRGAKGSNARASIIENNTT